MLWALFLAIIGTTIPTALFAAGIPKIGVGISSILMTIELPVAVICAVVVLNEHISPVQIAGIVVMLTAISIMNYYKSLKNKSNYILSLVEDNYIDTDLNIKYLIKYGVKNIDKIVYDSLEDLTISHNEYIKKIKDYEKKYSKEEVIMLLDNV